MVRVYLSLGSNQNREENIRASLNALCNYFGRLILSSVYESPAVGFDGDDFYNMVVGFDTNMPLSELFYLLRDIEHDNGRVRNSVKFSSRTLDIDILTYGDFVGEGEAFSLPRDEITENAFVLLPLAEIAPDSVHPVVGKNYNLLWQEYDQDKQPIWIVDFLWEDKKISSANC